MDDKGLMRAAVLASQLGFSVACPLAAFVIGGYWADGKFNTKPLFLLIGLFLGIVAAGAAFYQVAQAATAGTGAACVAAANVPHFRVVPDPIRIAIFPVPRVAAMTSLS